MGCGICGFVGLSDRNLLREMCDAIHHRGPDSTGYFIDQGIGLGVDRLKIIDLLKGDQPIHNEDSSIWLVLNGEIYNYLELREELESLGHSFYTNSDTETIVHAYETWGESCVLHLRGMFAFALWDARRRRLYLARDRFGKKPLYYAFVDGVFLFASEIKSILRFKELKREIDYSAMDLYFAYMYIPSPLTIFKLIRKLPPGYYAVHEQGEFATFQYWDFRLEPDTTTDEEVFADLLHEKLTEAVKIRLRSDVAVGAFLSGGIDSSVVASLMSRVSETPVKTVSIGFSDGETEVKYSRLVAEFLGTDHREYIVTPSAFEILPSLVSHFDEPFADHSFIPTYYLSQATRREAIVALSGDGGDEQFMGYDFLSDPAAFGVYSKFPHVVRRPLMKAIRSFPGDSSVRRMADHAFEKDYGNQGPLERYAMRVTSLDKKGVDRLYSAEFKGTRSTEDIYQYLFGLAGGANANDPRDVIDYVTIKSYLSEGILTKVDRMSMAVSLEVRCPLLDQELAGLVGRIPYGMKVRLGETKFIFKKMAMKHGLVPRAVVRRKKRGFGAPIETWLRRDWKDAATQSLDPIISTNYTGLFDRARVKKLLEDPYLNSNRLFSLMVFLMWYSLYIEENPLPSLIAGGGRIERPG